MIGATEPPWIGTGVCAGSGAVVVAAVVDVDVEVVVPLDARRRWDRAACAARPPETNDPANPQVPKAATATTMVPASTHRLRLVTARRRVRRSITHALSSPTASGGCYADESGICVIGLGQGSGLRSAATLRYIHLYG
jgi:hypothetical protein